MSAHLKTAFGLDTAILGCFQFEIEKTISLKRNNISAQTVSRNIKNSTKFSTMSKFWGMPKKFSIRV